MPQWTIWWIIPSALAAVTIVLVIVATVGVLSRRARREPVPHFITVASYNKALLLTCTCGWRQVVADDAFIAEAATSHHLEKR